MRRLLVALAVLVAGCSGSGAGGTGAPTPGETTQPPPTAPSTTTTTTATTITAGSSGRERTVGEDRPARLVLPPGWQPDDGGRALVVVLHGYTASGALQDLYLGVSAMAADFGYLTLTPDGTPDPAGNRFWNVSSFPGTVDDVSYLLGLIDEVVADYGVDPARVYVVGHSNGGFMAHRLACAAPGKITAIATLAGGIVGTAGNCTEPVRVIVMHGTADATVPYDGGSLLGVQIKGAEDTVEQWRTIDECGPEARDLGPFDFDLLVAGAETSITVWSDCAAGTAVELWTMEGSGHIPGVFREFRATLMERLLLSP